MGLTRQPPRHSAVLASWGGVMGEVQGEAQEPKGTLGFHDPRLLLSLIRGMGWSRERSPNVSTHGLVCIGLAWCVAQQALAAGSIPLTTDGEVQGYSGVQGHP